MGCKANLTRAFKIESAPATRPAILEKGGSLRHIGWMASLAFGVALVFVPPGYAQKTSTTFDEKFVFSQHMRYAWQENHLTRQHPDTNELMDLKIVKAVNQLLFAKGFVEVKDKPDFYLYDDRGGGAMFAVGGASQASSAPRAPNDPTPTYGLGNGQALAPASWLKVNGQIVFHMLYATARKPVWETIYSKTFRDPDKALRNFDKEVNELVSKSFKEFHTNLGNNWICNPPYMFELGSPRF